MCPFVVHGLLQTERYARALMDAAHRFRPPGASVDAAITARLARQQRLTEQEPLKLHVILDESVIMRVTGGAEVMREQLEHLLVMAERETITVQVVPYVVGAYGTMAGDCTIVTYPEPADSPNVYLEYTAGGNWVEDQEDVEKFLGFFRDTAEAALSPEETVRLINDRIGTLQ